MIWKFHFLRLFKKGEARGNLISIDSIINALRSSKKGAATNEFQCSFCNSSLDIIEIKLFIFFKNAFRAFPDTSITVDALCFIHLWRSEPRLPQCSGRTHPDRRAPVILRATLPN
jgi:hypothetical protein